MPAMPEPTPAPRPPRAPNDQRIVNTVTRQQGLLQRIAADAEALALLRKRRATADTHPQGLALAAAALDAYAGRDHHRGDDAAARASLQATDDAARRAFADLRTLLRALYPAPADRARLGIDARLVSNDRDVFLAASRATIATARTAPYAAELAANAYDAAALDTLTAALDALGAAHNARIDAAGQARTATTSRDDAYTAFQTFMTAYRRFGTPLMKAHPAIAARIGWDAK